MRLLKCIIFSFVLVLLASCSAIKVERLSDDSKLNKSGILYTLPKTKLNIKLKVIKLKSYKGPFSEFAYEYLGIENVIENNSETYQLSSVDVIPTIINDNDYTYLLTNYSKTIKSYSFFNSTQVLSAINTKAEKHSPDFINRDFVQSSNFIPFKDRTVKPLVVEKSDTVWKTILVDSVYKRIPKVNTAISPRTIKEQAYMASRFILKIRKRRLRVLTGMDDKFPKGDALKRIINELDKKENEYLNLFTGVEMLDTAIYNYSFVPDSSLQSVELFNFDKNRGVSPSSKYTFSISFNDNNTNVYYNKFNSINSKNTDLVYKTAKYIDVQLLLDSKLIKQVSTPIFQLGIINYIPSKNLDAKIIFDNKNGEYSILQ